VDRVHLNMSCGLHGVVNSSCHVINDISVSV
jgi:hypothetical protein